VNAQIQAEHLRETEHKLMQLENKVHLLVLSDNVTFLSTSA